MGVLNELLFLLESKQREKTVISIVPKSKLLLNL